MSIPLTRTAKRNALLQARRWAEVVRTLVFFGRRHKQWFISGALTALAVVGLRLILPWPMRAIMEPWLGKTHGRHAGLLALVPSGINPTLFLAGLFLLAILLLGFVDRVQRLCFAKFAIGSLRDLRAEAFRKVRAVGAGQEIRTGDLVARLIGDTARVKAGLKGFLVHVATNGAMFVGVTAVLLWIDVALGLIFVAAGILVGLVTVWGARRMYDSALKYRTKEGKLADFIQDSWESGTSGDFAEVNRSSGEHEAALTGIQGTTTWLAHIIIGLAIVVAVAYGAHAVSQQRISPGDLFVVMMYALMIRAPIVQLARQGARTGKILACGDRLERLLTTTTEVDAVDIGPLRDEIRVEGARVTTRRARTHVRRLGPIDISIPAGQRIAVLGKPGSGKTTLLDLLAGKHEVRDGRLFWDGQDLTANGATRPSSHVACLSHDPTWPRCRVRELLGVQGDAIDDCTRKLLQKCGANSLLKRLPKALDTKLGSSDLSPRERRALALASLVRNDASLWLLDDPFAALDKRKAGKLVKLILNANQAATVVMALSRPVRLSKFDRVIVLKSGRVAFDGTPAEWRAERDRQPAPQMDIQRESQTTGKEGVV